MRRVILYGIILWSVVWIGGCSSGEAVIQECYSSAQFKRLVAPAFSYYVMNVDAHGQSRLDLYLQMPYKKLRFQMDGFQYSASFSYLFLVRDSKGEIIQTKEIDRAVTVRTYEESVSLRSDFYLQTFLLPPATYTVEVISRDNLSQQRYRIVQTIEAKNFSNSTVSASTILLLDTIAYDAKGVVLRPILPEYVSLLSGSIGTFQEIYNIRAGDTLVISTRYCRLKQPREDERKKFTYWLPPYRIDDTNCIAENEEVYASCDSTFIATRDGTLQFIQLCQPLHVGKTIVHRFIVRRSAGRVDSVSTEFSLFRKDSSSKLSPSQDEILAAMRYILREPEYDSLVTISGNERLKKITEFWSVRGGSQRRFDFEKRVYEADQFFTTCMEGSRTPMGIVYIICGVPDYVDCRSDLYETWYYTLGERTYSVQFRAAGNRNRKAYFELNPFSVNELFWQYHIDQWRKKN